MSRATGSGGREVLQRFFPIAEWLPRYEKAWLAKDLVAGITVWALLVPEALAYAQIAGVPVQYGLYAAAPALAAYALFGGCRRLAVGPSSSVAIVSASVVAPLAAAGSDRYLAFTIALALMTGVLLVAGGLARLGMVAKFLAKPVLKGFIIGLALTIMMGQLGKLVGVHTSGDTAFQKTVSLLGNTADWRMLPFIVGTCCIAGLFLLHRFMPRLPGALVAVAATTLLAYSLGLGDRGLALVGNVPTGLPGWQLTGLALEDLYHLLPGALAVALVAYAESIAVAKTDASKYDYEIDPDQEMLANGMANIGSGLMQGFCVNGSLSRTAAGETAGGRTQLAMLACSALTLLTMLYLAGLFEYLPEATLGAVVIHALWRYFNPSELVRYYRVRRSDFALSVTALAGVVFFGIMPGIAAGVVLSLALLVNRVGSPHTAVLGREPGGGRFADIEHHPDFEPVTGVLVYRFDAAFTFPNAELFSSEVRRLVRNAEPPVTAVVLDFEVISDMDTTATDQLLELIDRMERKGVALLFARVHTPVRSFMERDGLIERIGERNFFLRVMDAVATAENRRES